MLSPRAHATSLGVTPTIEPGYPVVENPEFDATPNTMMYTVRSRCPDTFPDAASPRSGFTTSRRRWTATQRGPCNFRSRRCSDTDDTRKWTPLQLQPDTPYY